MVKKRKLSQRNYCPSFRDFRFISCCNAYNASRVLTASFGSCIALIFPMASFTFESCSISDKVGLSCFKTLIHASTFAPLVWFPWVSFPGSRSPERSLPSLSVWRETPLIKVRLLLRLAFLIVYSQ